MTVADEPFLRTLDRAVGAPRLAGLPPGDLEALLERQFNAVRKIARTARLPWRQEVIEWAGFAVGWLATAQEADATELIRIDILPDHQRQGIGSAVIARVLAQADAEGRPVRTRVLQTNITAADWYRRLGFVSVGGDAVMIRLERAPERASGTS